MLLRIVRGALVPAPLHSPPTHPEFYLTVRMMNNVPACTHRRRNLEIRDWTLLSFCGRVNRIPVYPHHAYASQSDGCAIHREVTRICHSLRGMQHGTHALFSQVYQLNWRGTQVIPSRFPPSISKTNTLPTI